MKHITTTFLKGLFTLLPALLSLYVILWFLNWIEGFSRDGALLRAFGRQGRSMRDESPTIDSSD